MQGRGGVQGADGQDDRAQHDGHGLQQAQYSVHAQVKIPVCVGTSIVLHFKVLDCLFRGQSIITIRAGGLV